MRRITLIMREEMADCRLPIEAEAICPETMSKTIDLSLFVGNEKKKITEVFDIRVDGEAAGPATTEIILVGDCSRVKRVGEYMTAGKIIIEGDIGIARGAEYKALHIAHTVERIDQIAESVAIERPGQSIDCEVAAALIVFDRTLLDNWLARVAAI